MENRKIIIELRKQGKTYKEIAAIVGYKSDSSVIRVCRAEGLVEKTPWKEKRYAEYRKYWNLGYKVKDIAEMFGVSEDTVRSAGCGAKKKIYDVPEEEMIALRRQGLSYGKIAATLGVTKDVIRFRCEKLGYGCPKREPQEPLEIREARLIEGYEYIGGWTGHDGKLKMRCSRCGYEFSVCCSAIRRDKTVSCPRCRATQIEHNKRLKAVECDLATVEKMLKQLAKDCGEALQQFNDCAKVHLCVDCGKQIRGRGKRCDRCQKKYTNRIQYQRREAKLRKAMVDRDIDLIALYHRDNGRCHICGGLCDLDDYWLTEDGNFVAGEGYPSIDHVIPLSKGGKHSWGNVKLAHKYCNTMKSDKIISPL